MSKRWKTRKRNAQKLEQDIIKAQTWYNNLIKSCEEIREKYEKGEIVVDNGRIVDKVEGTKE